MLNSKNVIEFGSRDNFAGLLATAPNMRRLMEERRGSLSIFPFILEDIFYALFTDTPKLRSQTATSTGARLNRLVLEQLMKSREFKRVREFTRQSRLGAAMAAMYFGEIVYKGLEHGIIETANEIFVTEEELEDAVLQEKVARKIAAIADSEGRQDAAELYIRSVEQWQLIAGEKKARLKSLAARLSMQWNTSGKKGITGAETSDKTEKEGKFETGADGIGDNKGVWTRGDLTPHLKLVETYYNSPKLKRLAQKIGRLKEVREQKQGRSSSEELAELRGIDYGNDLTMVVPEEWSDYFQPGKRIGFKKKYADEALCLYDMKGTRRKGTGSLIICLDNSGSMQGPKEETSKAIAIALMEIAMAQKRDFVIIMFGGPDDDMKVYEVPKGYCTFEQLVDIGEHFLCSAGTDFEKPLAEAVKYLERDRYPGGDIVFITDGVCNVGSEFLNIYKTQKKAKQFRTIGVLVNYGQVSSAPLEAFCDEILLSKDLKGVDIAGELFGKMRVR